MNLLGSLGIDLPLLLAQIANFALLIIILNYLVYRPLLRRIDEDEGRLQAADTELKKLAEEREAFDKHKQTELVSLNDRVTATIDEAQEIAEGIKRRVREETEQEKAAVIKQIKDRLREVSENYGQNKA